jgi:hypothetical protein
MLHYDCLIIGDGMSAAEVGAALNPNRPVECLDVDKKQAVDDEGRYTPWTGCGWPSVAGPGACPLMMGERSFASPR